MRHKDHEGMSVSKPAQASMPSEHMKMSPEKAGKILEHGEVKGKPLTKGQKGLFGAIRGKGRRGGAPEQGIG